MLKKTAIGIRAEDKSNWETRCPLVPEDIRGLNEAGLSIAVQASGRRAFSDAEYEQAGVSVLTDLEHCGIILGLKEIPIAKLEAGKTYFIFSHVIKGQAYNMPMLRRMMALGVTLVDYERIVDAQNRRLIFFGRHAGIAGMINSLWALGLRFAWENCPNPLTGIQQARSYPDLEAALEAVRAVAEQIRNNGVPAAMHPLVVGFAGYGNVAGGTQEVFDRLPFESVSPRDLADLIRADDCSPDRLYKVIFKEKHLVEPIGAGRAFDLQDYYRRGSTGYRGVFSRYAEHLTLLMNGNYWDPRFPRLLTTEDFRRMWAGGRQPKLKVIGDISCDINGALQCTVKPSYPDKPLYVYQPETGRASDGVAGQGPVVMAVEILPAEIPRESSIYFSRVLTTYLPAIAAADWSADFTRIALPIELKRAVILYRGSLTPEYEYLQTHLDQTG